MSRVGGAVSASRTFDITVTMKNGAGETLFSNINRYDLVTSRWSINNYADYVNREEQKPLEDFFQTKGLRTKNEMMDDVRQNQVQSSFSALYSLTSSP